MYLSPSTPHSQWLSLNDCFLEGLPTSHTHIPKEVSNSIVHASLFPEIRQSLGKIIIITERKLVLRQGMVNSLTEMSLRAVTGY